MTITDNDIDALLRLLAATASGMAIGLNRDMWGKPTGVRTLGLVALGAALVALATLQMPIMVGQADAQSRIVQGVIQGVLAGVGFIGAGVIMRDPKSLQAHGLTTAATVWVTASLGIAWALGPWLLATAGVAITLLLLVIVRPLEQMIENKEPQPAPDESDDRSTKS